MKQQHSLVMPYKNFCSPNKAPSFIQQKAAMTYHFCIKNKFSPCCRFLFKCLTKNTVHLVNFPIEPDIKFRFIKLFGGQCPASTWCLSVNIPIQHSPKNLFPIMLTMLLNFPQIQFYQSFSWANYMVPCLYLRGRGLLLREICKFPAFNQVKFSLEFT